MTQPFTNGAPHLAPSLTPTLTSFQQQLIAKYEERLAEAYTKRDLNEIKKIIGEAPHNEIVVEKGKKYLQLLKQRLTLIRELHEARNSNDPARIRTAIETAESYAEVDIKEHIDFSKQTLHAIEEHARIHTIVTEALQSRDVNHLRNVVQSVGSSNLADTFAADLALVRARIVKIESELALEEQRRRDEIARREAQSRRDKEAASKRLQKDPHTIAASAPRPAIHFAPAAKPATRRHAELDAGNSEDEDDTEKSSKSVKGYEYSLERNERRRRELENDPRYTDSHCVWIGNVFEKDVELLYDILRPAGPLVGIAFIHDTHTGKFKHCAFAQYVNKADAKKAQQMPLPSPFLMNYAADVKGGILKAGGIDVRHFDGGNRPSEIAVEPPKKKAGLASGHGSTHTKIRPCHKFLKGYCPHGDQCIYDHVKVENLKR